MHSAVIVHSRIVSINTCKAPSVPICSGVLFSVRNVANVPLPRPASFVNTPREMPSRMAKIMPHTPPAPAFSENAPFSIFRTAPGIWLPRRRSTAAHNAKNSPAMNGTSFSVTRTAFGRPPRTQRSKSPANITPASTRGTPMGTSTDDAAPVCAMVPMPSAESTQPAA